MFCCALTVVQVVEYGVDGTVAFLCNLTIVDGLLDLD